MQVQSISRFATPITSVLRTGMVGIENEEHLATYTEFDPQGKVLREVKYFDDGDIEEEHQYAYDSKGQLMLHRIMIPGEGIEERFETTRNEQGQPVQVVKFYGDDAGDRTTYAYDEKGRTAVVENFDADGEPESTEQFVYDESGRLIKRMIHNHEEDSKSHVHFRYDDAGNLIEQEEHNAENALLSKVIYTYNEAGLEIKAVHSNAKGQVISEVSQEFSEAGKLLRRVSRSFYIRITQIAYDDRGNVIEETLSDENDFVITRSHNEYDENNRLISETNYETDLTRTGRDKHLVYRYDYSFFS